MKNIIVVVILVVIGGVVIWNRMSIPKVAFVQTLTLVDQYKGMDEARLEYQKKKAVRDSEIDSLRIMVQSKIDVYKQMEPDMRDDERLQNEQYLQLLQQSFYQRAQELEALAMEEDEKMTMAVLEQINSFSVQYGKENGYNIILGAAMDGTILYGDDAYDITEEVLEQLNSKYEDN
ncbi:MAG: hypothetical protein C0594_07500 [Marinilabiliales bacterium]|nr:MAG: hypothetical protein C0594_07500 [Marinilabiliales bacterium]